MFVNQGPDKKRNFASPQKTQTSIVNYSKQKRVNNNATPERSALNRSFTAITSDKTIKSPPSNLKTSKNSNNPFAPLEDNENGDEDDEDDDPQDEEENSQQTEPLTDDATETSSTTKEIDSTPIISAQEMKLLPKKAQQALRKFRLARKILMDNSLKEEIEEVLGEGSFENISNGILKEGFTNKGGSEMQTVTEENNISHEVNPDLQHNKETQEARTEQTAQHTTTAPQAKEPTNNTKKPDETGFSSHGAQEGHSGVKTKVTRGVATKNVSFAEANPSTTNSHRLRQGNPQNPYLKPSSSKETEQGVLYPQRSVQTPSRVDKIVMLKKNMTRPHIHRYTLRFKIITPKTEEESQHMITETLQRFLDIILQADQKTIVPPYLELDRNDKTVQDLSSGFSVSSLDSFHALKKYFFRLSARDDAGFCWCSLILAQSISFSVFMDKAKYSLENNDFSLWPKASDNENSTDVGWLLYSTRAQDEDRLTLLLSKVTGENIGVKWKPIRAGTSNYRKKEKKDSEEAIRALHVECAVDRLQEVKDKLNLWYSSSSSKFSDGTKMRLVPTITAVTSTSNKTKFASCMARQAALTAGLASAITREISTNLLLDRKDPSTNKSFREVLMEISPQDKPGTTLFHTIDKQFKSDKIVNFQFHPDNASEANNLIAGLVPFLKDNGHSYHLKMFTPEALQRQAKAKWNAERREVDSEADTVLANLLAEDDELNFTNEPTLEKEHSNHSEHTTDPETVSIHIPNFPAEHMPSMAREDDSISTFHPNRGEGNFINLTTDENEMEIEEEASAPTGPPVSILRTQKHVDQDATSKMSMSDSASRISSLETEIHTMDKTFRTAIEQLKQQAADHSTSQSIQGSMLKEIYTMLKRVNISTSEKSSTDPSTSEVANPPQTDNAGDPSSGVAGHG